MSWKTDTQATRAAREVFPEHTPKVLRDGRQYLINPTPYGRVELLRIGEGFLVAAQDPSPPVMDPRNLPARLRRHLDIHGLRPWKVVGSDDCSEAIRSLVGAQPSEDGGPWGSHRAQPVGVTGPLSTYVCPIRTSAELLGENRIRSCHQVAGLVAGARQPGPLTQIVGPDGIGKRTMAATLATWLGCSLVGELPLARLLVQRILQTPAESLLEALLAAGDTLGTDDLLVVSDAELLNSIDGERLPMLRELARLPHVVLLARRGTGRTENVVSLACPGLEDIEDAREMVSAEHPELEFVGAGFELLARAASAARIGIVPGRLLYLIRLTKALLSRRPGDAPAEEDSLQPEADCRPDAGVAGGHGRMVLAPDEVSSALALTSSLWKKD